MTKISRSIHVNAEPDTFWEFMDMRKWCEISKIFTKVELPSAKMKVGDEVKVEAGPGAEKVNYTARITAYEPAHKLEYSRTGGPLPGKSEWYIASKRAGSEVHFNNSFNHDLTDTVKQSMQSTMDRFLSDLKTAVENGSNGKNGI